jgi:membrane protein DedA with SNARE-associated domain
VEQLFSNLVAAMRADVPSPLIYVIASLWLGLESAGIGVPIEPMLLFVGSLATRGGVVNPWLAAAATTLGCLAFSALAYAIGRRAGTKAIARVGRYIGLNEQRAEHIELWLRHRGAIGVLIARVTPMVRTFGSYMMGAADVPAAAFALGTLVGSAIYCGAFITLGAVLGYERPLAALDTIGWKGVAVVVAVVLVWIVGHHAWGRLTLQRIKLYYRQFQAKAAGVAAAAAGRG